MADNEEQLYPWALTTLQRVKDALGLTDSKADMVLTRKINAVTDLFEAECYNRRFLLQKYLNEEYSVYGARQVELALRELPVFYLPFSCQVTVNSNTLTSVSSTAGIQAGMPIQLDNTQTQNLIIPIGTTVVSVTANTIVMSSNANQSITSWSGLVNGLISFQYRAGIPTQQGWTNFTLDQFELVNNGKAGLVRVYGVMPRIYDNQIRATYWAGYLIDFKNAGNPAYHTLPAAISQCVENITIRWWKRRDHMGEASKALEGSTISYKDELDKDDLRIISIYRRQPIFM